MSTLSVVLIDDAAADDKTSNFELSISSNSMSTSSPKTLERSRNYIWSHFDDEGEAKTGGYRKAWCRYCMTLLSYRHNQRYRISFFQIVTSTSPR